MEKDDDDEKSGKMREKRGIMMQKGSRRGGHTV